VATNRLLVPDCPNNALLSLDLATGERSALVEFWPWAESDSTSCVTSVLADPSGGRAFAVVERGFTDPTDPDGGGCSAVDLVIIDTATRDVTPIQNIHYDCSDDGGTHESYHSLQVDAFQQRLLFFESDCDPNFCNYPVSGISLHTLADQYLYTPYTPECYPDDEGCSGDTWMTVTAMSFDPADPDHRLLLLVRRDLTDEYRIDSLDLTTGTLTVVAEIEPTVEGLPIGGISGFSIDAEKQRALFVTAAGPNTDWSWVVVAVDLLTGAHSFLYDGSPTAGGAQLECGPDAAFDADGRRVLLAEPIGNNCSNGVFAVDADTGAFTQVASRIE
jgi:hypothetical protein